MLVHIYSAGEERSDLLKGLLLELVVMISGELILVDDAGETPMRPGDVALFPAGVANGHHLVNRSDMPARFMAAIISTSMVSTRL